MNETSSSSAPRRIPNEPTDDVFGSSAEHDGGASSQPPPHLSQENVTSTTTTFPVAAVHRSASSAYVPRPTYATSDGGASSATSVQQQRQPPRRSVTSVLRYNNKKKYAVRNSLLANIFFPHEHSHKVVTVDDAKTSRQIQRANSKLQLDRTQAPTAQDDEAANEQGNDDDVKEDGGHPDDGEHTDTILERAARAIQSKHAQWFFTALLVLDVFLIIAELVIESNKYCVLEPLHDVHHVSPSYHSTNPFCNTTEITYLGKSSSNHRVRFFESSQADCPFEAIPELSHGLHKAETILSWMGKAIIFIFAAELLVLVAALRTHFFTNRMYLIDFVIVTVSIVVEWTVSKDEPSAQLVILVRCWRFARILHGVGISLHEIEEIEVEHLVDHNGNIVTQEEANDAAEKEDVGETTAAVPPSRRDSVLSRVSNGAASEVGTSSVDGGHPLQERGSFVHDNGRDVQPLSEGRR